MVVNAKHDQTPNHLEQRLGYLAANTREHAFRSQASDSDSIDSSPPATTPKEQLLSPQKSYFPSTEGSTDHVFVFGNPFFSNQDFNFHHYPPPRIYDWTRSDSLDHVPAQHPHQPFSSPPSDPSTCTTSSPPSHPRTLRHQSDGIYPRPANPGSLVTPPTSKQLKSRAETGFTNLFAKEYSPPHPSRIQERVRNQKWYRRRAKKGYQDDFDITRR
ncbi:hypothetical protein BT69DRAFT_1117337 [Atractiella rhizophila]|nr:hypothetical protein BT69DRAFT_1117337 [Atractiella rhizophila]